jgi:cardiolipin synthase
MKAAVRCARLATVGPSGQQRGIMTATHAWDRTHIVGEDRLTPLAGGPERLEALVALIDRAVVSLRVLYYIYADDVSGRRVRDALVAAQGRGVAVTLIVDGFGSDKASDDFFRPLEAAGAGVCRFLPRLGRRYLLRNHQKLALADAETDGRAIVGGFNVEDDYFGTAAQGAWRDLGLVVEGPAAGRLAGYFDTLADWTRRPNARVRTLRCALERYSESQGPVRWLLGGPTARLSPWGMAMRTDMRTAVRVDMIAAYFAPNPGNLRRIERVKRRNHGRVRIITAGKSDNDATIGAARHTYARLLRRGVRVAEYQPAKLHTKLYVIGNAVHLGSANFDMRSLYINLEMMLRVEDAAFARAMKDYFVHEWRHSTEIGRERHKKVGWWLRLKWSAAYYVVAVLDYGVTRRLNFGFG